MVILAIVTDGVVTCKTPFRMARPTRLASYEVGFCQDAMMCGGAVWRPVIVV